ncbi:MAG: hypothetical protein WC971_06855 [Coriobacteriia bacterium]
MAKVNVSIPDTLLAEVDDLANGLHASRSGFVAEATARYVTEVRTEQARLARAERIRRGIADARSLSERIGAIDGVAAVRDIRDASEPWLGGASE